MATRMFVALVPPAPVIAALESFVEPRRDADERLRFLRPENWHITVAFLGDVDVDREEPLEQALAGVAARSTPFPLTLGGGGAFPGVPKARTLWAGVDDPTQSLSVLARRARAASHRVGIPADGGRFVAHLTLARARVQFEATHWLRVLSAFESQPWMATTLSLVASHLGVGPGGAARYVVREEFAFGSRPESRSG